MKTKTRTVLINGGTHGTEQIGPNVIASMRKRIRHKSIRYHIAHPEALKKGVRFEEKDLNRCFPGDPNGALEEQIAHKIHPLVTESDVVIDIHSTESGLRKAIILTTATPETLRLVKWTNARYVLLMQITRTNALISDAKIGIGFEFGKDKDPRTLQETIDGVVLILNALGHEIETTAKPKARKICFRITEVISKPLGYIAEESIKNYKRVLAGEPYAYNPDTGDVLCADEDFYPLIFNEPRYTDIFGFKGYRDYEMEDTLRTKCSEGGPHYFKFAPYLNGGKNFCVDCGFVS